MEKKTLFIVPILAAATLIAGCAGAAFAQTETPTSQTGPNPPERTLTVSGAGKVYLTPDIAYVTIGVHTEGPNASKAVADNTTQAQEVINVLKGMGIAARDIQTTNFSIYPQPVYDNEGRPTGEINYIVDNSVYVTVRDLEQVGDVLDQTVEAGANSISGIQFDVENKTAALSEARKAAVTDAFGKAQELAAAAGVDLGPVQTISEYTSSPPTPMFDLRAAAPAIAESAVPVEAGQMLLTIEVNIVYQIQ
jgi:hypothetical protein